MKKKTKRGASLFSIFLMVAVAIGLMPQLGAGEAYAAAEDLTVASGVGALSVNAEGDSPALTTSTSVLGDKANTADAQTVYMAGIAWRVIGCDGTGVASAPGMVTLISNGFAKEKVDFNQYGERWQSQEPEYVSKLNDYSSSNLKKGVDAVVATFGEGERSAIRTRDLASGSYDGLNTDCISGDEVKDALLWPLSAKEADSLDMSLRALAPGGYWSTNAWWLRSPGSTERSGALVEGQGAVFDRAPLTNTVGVRPAFYLDPGSLAFVSAAEGGKSCGAEGAGSLEPVGANTSGEWKVTARSGHDNFAVRKVTANWGRKVVVVSYEGAATGENEHISAIIKDADGNVKYYGNLKSCASAGDASGAVVVNVDGKLGDGDRLYVFNEQLNGDKKTDYASELVEVEVPAGAKAFKELYSSNYLRSGWYRVSKNMTLKPKRGMPNGLRLAHGAKVLIYIDEGATLTVYGRSPSGYIRHGSAAIRVDAGTTLIITGKGTLNATGGNAGNGDDGGKAEGSSANRTGNGGNGGEGGGGAGAGIGTDGGAGGSGGAGGAGISCDDGTKSNSYGNNGSSGKAGNPADPAGTVIIAGSVTVNAKGGSAGNGGKAGSRGWNAKNVHMFDGHCTGTSGGGGGGAGGGAADGIGCGGTGGGGGGGGASANVDGECAIFKGCDLADLWSYGGSGGSGSWGGGNGESGGYGATNDVRSDSSYAKSGGSGGSSVAPMAMTFYTYRAFGSTPTVTCRSGHGATREATSLDLRAFEELGGEADMVGDPSVLSGGLAAQAAQPDGAPALSAQADGDAEPIWVDSGTESVEVEEGASIEASYKVAYYDAAGNPLDAAPVDPGEYVALIRYAFPEGYESYSGDCTVWFNIDKRQEAAPTLDELTFEEASYEVAYYDEAGNLLDAAPVDPGEYVALVRYTSPEGHEGYSSDCTVRFTVDKRQVAVPTPAELTFKVADWRTGEGAEQDAFEGLDGDIEFVEASKTVDGATVVSTRSAKDVGGYEACFRLKDPETCEWADGSKGSDEVWVRWFITPDTYDPNSGEVMYWGTAYDKAATSVAYTGKPIWVRPWYTPTKASGGEFPEWMTHWGDAGRPTDNRSSACVVYLGEGMEDYAGIVGYHTNADGSLEPVTGMQVYAWICGVDIDGKHVDVQSGDKIWYKVGEGDEVTVLAVQNEEPEGADGCVVARDHAYADKLGVMDEGIYETYAFFDEGTGFEPLSLAETTVTVGKASISKAEVTLSKTSYIYNGKAKRPAVKSVTLNGRKLKAGVDYEVSYKNNVKPGKATVTVTGKGSYTGSARATFEIALGKTKISTAGHVSAGSIDVSWSKVKGAKGYQLQYRQVGGKWKTMSVKGTSKVVKGLKAGKLYQIRVRASAGKTKGAWSDASRRYLRSAGGVKATSNGAGTVTATWKADPKVNAGYTVVVGYQRGGAVAAKVNVAKGKTKATVKGLKAGKKLWVQVRPLCSSGGKTYVGVYRGVWAKAKPAKS